MIPLQFWLEPAAVAKGASFKSPRKGDAGFDICACETVLIQPGAQALVPTGLHLAIPLGFVGIVKDRSSMAVKGIHSHAGVIDASYRGEVKVLLANRGSAPFSCEPGARIAQLVVVAHLEEALPVGTLEDLGGTVRGSGGFGSTGS